MSSHKLSRTLHFFGAGVIDQVVLSGANFLAGLLMIRHTSDVAYGQFVLAQSTILLLVATQSAWLTWPLTVVAPKKTVPEKVHAIGTLRASQTRILRRVGPALVLASVLGWLFGLLKPDTAIVTAAIVIACWVAMQREYLRGVLILWTRPNQLLRTDVVYATSLVVGVLAATRGATSAGVLAIGALIISALLGQAVSYRMLNTDPGWVSGDAKPLWRELRPIGLWATVGSVTYWVFGQSYNYILASRFDLTAVSGVNAARLVLTPIFVFTIGINNVLVSSTANWLAEIGMSKTLRRLLVVLLTITTLDLIYMGLAWSIRDWLITGVLHKTIADRDELLLLWGSIALIFLPREILQAVLFASGQMKSMTGLIGVSAVSSLALTWYGIGRWGTGSVLIGQIAGELVNLIGLGWMLWRHVRNRSSGALPPALGTGHIPPI